MFYLVCKLTTSPRGLILNIRGDLTEGFLCHRFGGLIFGGAYTLGGLFSEFYSKRIKEKKELMALREMYGGQGNLANHYFIMNHYIMNGNT